MTRAADRLSIAISASSFNPATGTFVLQTVPNRPVENTFDWLASAIAAAPPSNFQGVYATTTDINFRIQNGGVALVDATTGAGAAPTVGTPYSLALAYGNTVNAESVSGSTGTAAAVTAPATNIFLVGQDPLQTRVFDQYVQHFNYYPRRISDSDLSQQNFP